MGRVKKTEFGFLVGWGKFRVTWEASCTGEKLILDEGALGVS